MMFDMNDPWEEVVAARTAFQEREQAWQAYLIAQDESSHTPVVTSESVDLSEEIPVKATSKKSVKEQSSQQ